MDSTNHPAKDPLFAVSAITIRDRPCVSLRDRSGPVVLGGGLLLLFCSMETVEAQDPVPFSHTPDLQGVDLSPEFLPGGLDGKYDGEGFVFGLGLSGVYDSNLYLSESDEIDDFSLLLSPSVRYSSAPPGGALWILNASYAPVIRRYLDQDDLDGLDHAAQVALGYDGPVTRFSTNAGYSRAQQANRFIGGQTETEQHSLAFSAGHILSGLTSLAMDFSHSTSETTGFSGSEVETTVASVSVLWDATPLVKVGPTMRFSQRTSGSLGDSESIGLLATVDYALTGVTKLGASAGLETVSATRDGDSGTSFTGGISLSYRPPDLPWSASAELAYGGVRQASAGSRYGGGGDSPISGSVSVSYTIGQFWVVAAGLRYESFPSPGGEAYSINDFSGTFSVARELGTGSVKGSLSVGESEFEGVDGAPERENQDNMEVSLAHQTQVLDERASLQTALSYSENGGDRDYSRWQLTMGLRYEF